jgi:hypothetical protein
MRNLSRINNYYNRIQAEQDFKNIAMAALRCGYREVALAVYPGENATTKELDKAIMELRQRIAGDHI